MNDWILVDLGTSFAVALVSLGAMHFLKHMETARALKISAVVFVASATVIGIIILWLNSRAPSYEPVNVSMYAVHTTIPEAYQQCLQQCESIADKASEAFNNCVNACTGR